MSVQSKRAVSLPSLLFSANNLNLSPRARLLMTLPLSPRAIPLLTPLELTYSFSQTLLILPQLFSHPLSHPLPFHLLYILYHPFYLSLLLRDDSLTSSTSLSYSLFFLPTLLAPSLTSSHPWSAVRSSRAALLACSAVILAPSARCSRCRRLAAWTSVRFLSNILVALFKAFHTQRLYSKRTLSFLKGGL